MNGTKILFCCLLTYHNAWFQFRQSQHYFRSVTPTVVAVQLEVGSDSSFN